MKHFHFDEELTSSNISCKNRRKTGKRKTRICSNSNKPRSNLSLGSFTTKESPVRLAREKRNLDVKTVAKKLRCSEAYVRHAENGNGISWVMAQRLSEIYQCNMMLFLRTNEVKAPRRLRRRALREKKHNGM